MCGICGIYHLDRDHRVSPELLGRVNDRMLHRGPDGSGIHVDRHIGLGHRRLSIIDLNLGQQPMCNEDGSVWITYNGEIYNYKELKSELLLKGHKFRSDCDTEVLIHGYEEYGPDWVKRCNGMFAFAIWDPGRETLLLARDRMGVKPLYYYADSSCVIFASEIKAILQHPDVQANLELAAIPEYLFSTAILEDRTMFQGIRSLPPGCELTVADGRLDIKSYWELNLDDNRRQGGSLRQWKEEFAALLEEAVQMRLMSEVPFGTLLSGGLDSSLLTALAVKSVPSGLNTFSLEFSNNVRMNYGASDTRYARLLSDQLSTNHHEYLFDPAEYTDILGQVTWHMEKPVELTTPSLYLLYRQVKQAATVVISGEGADELFGGYFFFLQEAASGGMSQFPWAPYQSEVSGLLVPEIEANTGYRSRLQHSIEGMMTRFHTKDRLNKVLYMFLKVYLLEMLERQDKMSMASSVEVRVPFLDYRIVEMISCLPSEYKLQGDTEKWFLKEVSRAFLPAEIVDRKKKPFPFPVDPKSIFRQRGAALELVESGNSRISDYFDRKKVADFMNKRGDYAKLDNLAIFRTAHAMLALELWHKTFGV
ncbi:asparagine synthase (glutamine-hydrolyzing) [Paenibacillus tepidiphilus]|uniref:asparagine synthase (glutamine-hydrolyzing) n=1 Tax=Paenibacillus tepidiphilus TaxID=2608683 RepID=UPI0012384288|nr:asparagine synthase (glutamine-hydrolyzing) [Paenibacillus tepidiphilus]